MMMEPPFEVGRHHNEKEARIVRQAIALLKFHVLCSPFCGDYSHINVQLPFINNNNNKFIFS